MTAVAFSADGTLLGSADNGGTAKIWETASGKLRQTIPAHPRQVAGLVFSPNGKALATVSRLERVVKLWSVENGGLLHALEGHTAGLQCVSFSPDGRQLASAGVDQAVRLWDVESGKPVRVLPGAPADADGLEFSQDGKLIAAAGSTGCCLWDVESGWTLGTLTSHQGLVRSVTFLPDGRTLATSGEDRTIRLWDLETLHEKRLLHGKPWVAITLACRADGRLLAFDDNTKGTIGVWDLSAEPVRTHEIRLFQAGAVWVRGLALSPEGRYLATANPDGTVCILRLAERGKAQDEPQSPGR
jgi:WD40 repeat protein